MSSLYLLALAITLAVEVPVVALVYRGQRVRMAAACVLATTTTHLAMHFLLPRALPRPGDFVLLGELLALGIEAGVYATVSRPREADRALMAAGLANALSYAAGLLVFR